MNFTFVLLSLSLSYTLINLSYEIGAFSLSLSLSPSCKLVNELRFKQFSTFLTKSKQVILPYM